MHSKLRFNKQILKYDIYLLMIKKIGIGNRKKQIRKNKINKKFLIMLQYLEYIENEFENF